MNATIWLVKGEHFLIQCEKSKWKGSNQSSLLSNQDALCELDSLKMFYPKSDNVNFKIQTFDCDSEFAKNTKLARFDINWFYRVCANLKNKDRDERAVIHVNNPKFYFNITKSAQFNDLIFDGINSFAYIEANESSTNE